MYILQNLSDCIRVAPSDFRKPLKAAIADQLNRKLSNKVVANIGLGIALYDITKIDDSHILPGDGGHHTPVEFRFVMFRPFPSEVLIGKVKSCGRDGVHVTLGFFDDIFIPEASLQHPSRFDESEQVWVWEYQVEDSKHDLFMDVGEPIRIRIVSEHFEETLPSGGEEGPERESSEQKIPYMLIATINEPGLGLLSWWNQQQEAAESGQEEEGGESPKEMLGPLVSEMTDLLMAMKRCRVLDSFSFTVVPSSNPMPNPVSLIMATLLNALECCNGQLRVWVEQRQHELTSEPFNCKSVEVNSLRLGSDAPRVRPFIAKTDVSLGESGRVNRECLEALNLKIENESGCFEAVNLSIAPSPTCLEALNLSVATSPAGLNLSVATSPCFHTADVNVGTTTDFKTLLDVGTSTECWDQVNLDVGGSVGYFEPVNLHAGPSVGFTHDGDIFNMGAREDLNSGLCFELDRDEAALQITQAESVALSVLEELPLLPAALDLSQAAAGYFAPSSPCHGSVLHSSKEVVDTNEGSPEAGYSCNECGKSFAWRKSLRRHLAEHGGRKHLCTHCGKSYTEAWRLRRHEAAHRGNGFFCKICRRNFEEKSKLRRHYATHMIGEFICSICNKEFTRQDLLKRHVEITHLKSRKFPCRLCSKVFSVKCNLDTHENSVHGGAVEACDLCGKECKNKATLRQHRKTHMVPTYSCEICGRQFHRQIQYRNHKQNKHPINQNNQNKIRGPPKKSNHFLQNTKAGESGKISFIRKVM